MPKSRPLPFERPIERPVVVAVEGLDYEYLLKSQLERDARMEPAEVRSFGGVHEIERCLELMKSNGGYHMVKCVGIIRDAEESAENAKAAIRRALRTFDLPVPARPGEVARRNGCPSTSYLVMPHDSPAGCLEDALLRAVASNVRLDCANEFLKCVDDGARNDAWKAKVKVHALIAASDKPADTLGQSAKNGLWNFGHPALQVMLDFVRGLVDAM